TPTTGIERSEKYITRHVLYRSAESPRFCRPHALVGSACSVWSPAANDHDHPSVSHGMRARVKLDGGEISAWFHVCQGLRQVRSNTESMRLWSCSVPQRPSFVYLGDVVSTDVKMSIDVNHRTGIAWARLRIYISYLCD
ncbi:unnamed protein product, partial [Sphacelaria rigidula]